MCLYLRLGVGKLTPIGGGGTLWDMPSNRPHWMPLSKPRTAHVSAAVSLVSWFHPVRFVRRQFLPRNAAPSAGTHATTPDEVLAMLNVLTGTARTAVALMYFAGLRPSEARATRWEHFNGKTLQVPGTKTAASGATISVPEILSDILSESRQDVGYILASPTGKQVDLHNLTNRVVIPALAKAGIEWHGWYAFRRGCATLAAALDSPLAAKGYLRHSNIATTQQYYIKDVADETARLTTKVDALFAAKQVREPVQ
jgi:integrase